MNMEDTFAKATNPVLSKEGSMDSMYILQWKATSL